MLHFFHFELFVPCESKSYVIFSEDHVVDDCILRKLNKTMIKEWTKLDKEDVHIWLPASQAIAAWKMREKVMKSLLLLNHYEELVRLPLKFSGTKHKIIMSIRAAKSPGIWGNLAN